MSLRCSHAGIPLNNSLEEAYTSTDEDAREEDDTASIVSIEEGEQRLGMIEEIQEAGLTLEEDGDDEALLDDPMLNPSVQVCS